MAQGVLQKRTGKAEKKTRMSLSKYKKTKRPTTEKEKTLRKIRSNIETTLKTKAKLN
ncbi:hypothetical protein NECID01_0001 [Nematocida sp. AWRm77]|nr:hypothetical protein NECID01_0001 [Nematocida sp. AWRm77]